TGKNASTQLRNERMTKFAIMRLINLERTIFMISKITNLYSTVQMDFIGSHYAQPGIAPRFLSTKWSSQMPSDLKTTSRRCFSYFQIERQ
ncbi:11580_t:CDS:2, partial [Acaulospora morrowiae]